MNPSDQARQVGVVDSWLSQVEDVDNAINPAASTVLATTGALAAGYYDVFYGASFSAALAYYNLVFYHQNAADSAVLWGDYFIAAAAGGFRNALKNVKLAANERFKFVCESAYTGQITTWIIAIRRA